MHFYYTRKSFSEKKLLTTFNRLKNFCVFVSHVYNSDFSVMQSNWSKGSAKKTSEKSKQVRAKSHAYDVTSSGEAYTNSRIEALI